MTESEKNAEGNFESWTAKSSAVHPQISQRIQGGEIVIDNKKKPKINLKSKERFAPHPTLS